MEGDANATCDSGNIVRPFCRCEKCCSKDYRYIDGIRQCIEIDEVFVEQQFLIYLITIACDGKMDNFKGSTCQLTCDENYELNGDNTIECTGEKKDWSWNKNWPACDPGTTKMFKTF